VEEEGIEGSDPPAVGAPGITDPLFVAARDYFVTGGARPGGGGLFLFVTLLLFVFSVGATRTLSGILILVAVLVVHELGHYLGMRVFGYRDVRMFFVPFLGAAVSGRRGSVAAWKDAIVLLLGPVPGVLAGCGVMIAGARWPHPYLIELGETLLLVNAFNLLPFGGLDGGKLLLRVLFSRNRYLEIAFTALGSLALAALAFAGGSFVLGLFALASLAALPRRLRVLEAAQRLRSTLADASAAALGDADARRLFDEACLVPAAAQSSDPRALGSAMEDILLAAQRPPGILASFALFGIWAGTCAFAFVAAVVLAVAFAPAEWQRRPFAACSAEMPDAPRDYDESWATPIGQRTASVHGTTLDIVERFTLIELDAGADIAETDRVAWEAAARTRLQNDLGGQGATFVSERDTDMGGRPGHESVWSTGWRVWHARTLVDGRYVHVLIASSPEDTANASRFLDSFQLGVPAPVPPTAPAPVPVPVPEVRRTH
jgi:hypothetical protein